jgi:hypothetical protein
MKDLLVIFTFLVLLMGPTILALDAFDRKRP